MGNYITENGGWSNWNLVELEQFPCNTLKEVKERARYWHTELKADLNDRKLGITDEEKTLAKQQYKLDYNRKNAIKIGEYKRERNKEIREKV